MHRIPLCLLSPPLSPPYFPFATCGEQGDYFPLRHVAPPCATCSVRSKLSSLRRDWTFSNDFGIWHACSSSSLLLAADPHESERTRPPAKQSLSPAVHWTTPGLQPGMIRRGSPTEWTTRDWRIWGASNNMSCTDKRQREAVDLCHGGHGSWHLLNRSMWLNFGVPPISQVLKSYIQIIPGHSTLPSVSQKDYKLLYRATVIQFFS
jgi:hypothetical protein